MDTGREQIDLFLRKCDELMQSKFIIADTKISELLKSIVASDLLYAFFREITKNFDYTAAKEKYLGYAPHGSSKSRQLLFPQDPAENLAFIFCLFVEFDNKTMDISDFLREYFYEDGSLYESFYAFCNQVVKPFRNAVKLMFRGGRPVYADAEPAGAAETRRLPAAELRGLARAEKDAVFASALSDDKKVDALLLLNALEEAAERGGEAVCAPLCGYAYFAAALGWRSENMPLLLAELERRKREL